MNWQQFVLENEVGIRLGFFFGIFGLMVVWELLAPRRALTVSKTLRWVNNLGLVFLNSFVLRLLFPAAAVGVAAWAQRQGWGLLNQFQLPILLVQYHQAGLVVDTLLGTTAEVVEGGIVQPDEGGGVDGSGREPDVHQARIRQDEDHEVHRGRLATSTRFPSRLR